MASVLLPDRSARRRTAGALLVAGVAVGLAGCSGGASGSSGTASSGGSPTSTSTAEPSRTTAASSAPAAPLAGRVVVIDPGHNGGNASNPREVNRQVDAGFGVRKACNTTGTETNAGYAEHAQVWDVSTRLASLLRARGAKVVLTRSSDDGVGPCVDVRGRAGTAAKADAMISVHADGNASASARGFHVIWSGRMVGGAKAQDASKQLATAVHGAFARGTGMPNAGYLGGGSGITRRTDLGTLNLSSVPSVMIESGNMRNATDARLLSDPAFRQREATALADGLSAYLRR
ncbi:N-acetylmuramoyl-L-alanine amidase [Luteipulveratus halotolerans]|uniref:MurNAc-LAA domain-containing protein n=1 Tax=Luteipulveratus halotolerans TaxID=1631356 RepID=A0A0L6CK24_9MICO|nr:N-acetylmuramoyl-L-alanine amidase [Luteipulveratus halotolerans]KNX38127.1 hypothetical protein VV01_14790 [Luteipulveratus halotolerans]